MAREKEENIKIEAVVRVGGGAANRCARAVGRPQLLRSRSARQCPEQAIKEKQAEKTACGYAAHNPQTLVSAHKKASLSVGISHAFQRPPTPPFAAFARAAEAENRAWATSATGVPRRGVTKRGGVRPLPTAAAGLKSIGMYGGTQSALLYSGELRLVFTLISCIYGWLFAGLMNACNYALLEVLLRRPIVDEKARLKISSLLMRCIAAIITIALVFCELEYMVELQGARVFIMSAAVIATAAGLEIGKKGENMAWNLLAHHVAIIGIILYAFDRLIWATANYLDDANGMEFAAFLTSENIFTKLPKYPRASVEMIIKYAQLQVLGTALELPTTITRLHDCVKKYAAKYEPTWQDYLPNSRSMYFASFACWVLLKVIFVPAFTIYLLVEYADESKHIWFTYYVVAVTQVIFWMASLWVCRRLWLRFADEVNSKRLSVLATREKKMTKTWSFTSASSITTALPTSGRKLSVTSTDISDMDIDHLYSELGMKPMFSSSKLALDQVYEEEVSTPNQINPSKKIWWAVKGVSYFGMSFVSVFLLFYLLRL